MAPLTDQNAAAILERAAEAVRRSRELRSMLNARSGSADGRMIQSEVAERRLIAEHHAALVRELSR